MKMIYLSTALCGLLTGLSPLSIGAQDADIQSAESRTVAPMALAKNNVPASDKPAKLSWGLDEIVKLSKAKVEGPVILAFIENSETAYNPTAQDIIQLRESGVSSEVVTALMRHGENLRQTARAAQKQVQAEQTAAVAAAPVAATTVYETPPTDAAPVSTVTVIGYPRHHSYAYPAYNPGYCYPGSYYYPRYYSYGYYPRFSVGLSFGGGYYRGHHGWGRHCR